MNFLSSHVTSLVRLALEEDDVCRDITSELTIPEGRMAEAEIVAREELVVSGLPIIPVILNEARASVSFESSAKEGELASSGEKIARLKGEARELLALERTMLNFLQRTCGVATLSREFRDRAPSSVTVLDTRKTIPGWRDLDKYSVRVGGLKNHRNSLADMILVKNNHIDANRGDIGKTLGRIMSGKSPYIPVEVEVRSRDELMDVLPYAPQIIMLDNMNLDQIKECIAVIRKSGPTIQIELSGGYNIDRLAELSVLGEVLVSVGSLTTAARNRDISMRLIGL